MNTPVSLRSGPAAATYKLASVLLQYPTMSLLDGLDTLREAADAVSAKSAREALGRFLTWLGQTPPTAIGQHYVETFDLRRRCALYLTYYRYGDTRERGLAMVQFKTAYRTAGYVPSTEELPDYLPMVLDFAACAPRGERLLHMHRSDLELLRRALEKAGTPYLDVVVAVAGQLPKLGRREQAMVRKAWQAGPPREEVGIEPFAPPEYLAGYGSDSTANQGVCR